METVELSTEELWRALPVVRATWPRVGLSAWHGFVGSILDRARGPEAGTLALQDRTQHLSGVLVYRREQDLFEGDVLTVPLFTVADLANSVENVRLLYEAARSRAAALDCRGVQIRLYSDQGALAERLRRIGLLDGAGLLWKPINATGSTTD